MDQGGEAGGPPPLPSQDARRDPSTHQLRLFLVLAEELHFGRAAARMFMTQPSFSQQIRALEKRLDVPLVRRSSRAVELTRAGRALVPEARATVDAMARLRQLTNLHARELHGHLTVGSIGAEAAMPYTRAILTELRNRHPSITIEMRSLNFAEQIDVLTSGEVDVAFLRPPVPSGLKTLHLATEPRVVCLSADDPLAGHPHLTLAQLAHHTVVDVPPGAPRIWWNYWAVNPRPDGTPVRFGPVVADIEAMLLAVARGQAITFLPAGSRELYPRPGVAYVDVTDLPPSTAALTWLPKNHARPTITALREAARTILRQNPPDPAPG